MSDEPINAEELPRLRICRDCRWRKYPISDRDPLRCAYSGSLEDAVGEWFDRHWSSMDRSGEPVSEFRGGIWSCPGHDPVRQKYDRWLVAELSDESGEPVGAVLAKGLTHSVASRLADEWNNGYRLSRKRRYLFRRLNDVDPDHTDRDGTYAEEFKIGDLVRRTGGPGFLVRYDPVADLRAAVAAAAAVFEGVDLGPEEE